MVDGFFFLLQLAENMKNPQSSVSAENVDTALKRTWFVSYEFFNKLTDNLKMNCAMPERVARYTNHDKRQVNIFNYDKVRHITRASSKALYFTTPPSINQIYFPIWIANHYGMVIADMKNKRLIHCDPMGDCKWQRPPLYTPSLTLKS